MNIAFIFAYESFKVGIFINFKSLKLISTEVLCCWVKEYHGILQLMDMVFSLKMINVFEMLFCLGQ